ncbi:MAG: hypothetical protein LBT20_01100, partial [Clostridiales bacterium]|nr:hypothetical protein [Clostridiales bacterium]
FVNPGDIHIKSHITNPIKSNELYSTAFKTAAGTVVILSNNTGRRVNIKFPTNYSNITVYKTDSVLQLDMVYSGGLNAYLSTGEGYKFEADSKSIYTIIFN